jgi:acyl carrier protein
VSDTPEPLEYLLDLVAQITWTDRSKVRPEARFIDFGLDSVKAMDLVVQLEETYELEIPDRDLADLNTLADVARYVDERRGG